MREELNLPFPPAEQVCEILHSGYASSCRCLAESGQPPVSRVEFARAVLVCASPSDAKRYVMLARQGSDPFLVDGEAEDLIREIERRGTDA